MRTVNVREAKTTLSKLLEDVERGETIVIARNGHPVAELTAIRRPTMREAVDDVRSSNPLRLDGISIRDAIESGRRQCLDRRRRA